MSEMPLVSILLPVYNAGEYLRPSLESIRNQTYSNLEILIINDGSTDGCMETIADVDDPRIRVLSHENAGRAATLNRGIRELKGEFYATHDADDISLPQRIEKQVEVMLADPDVAAVFTGHEMILSGRVVAPRHGSKSREQCRADVEQFRMPAHDPTGMFRVSGVQGIWYEESLRLAAGLDYILRVGERLPMIVLGDCLYAYRVHGGASTRRQPDLRQRMVRRVLERACARRDIDCNEELLTRLETGATSTHREYETGVVPHFMESVLDLRRAGRVMEALRTAVFCLKLHPLDTYYYKPLAYLIAPFWTIEHHRRRRAKRP